MLESKEKIFSKYQVFMIAVLAILQFTVVLDFMVISPLGVILMDKLRISPEEFGTVVSAYAFSAGISGLLVAGFADKFDRKKLLLFFYVGFLLGTVLCAMAPTFEFLLAARIVTGIFGGVIGSISYAIITDLFRMETRGRVMGFVQMAFSASQVLGIPLGLLLAKELGWHWCFWMIAVMGTVVGAVILIYMKPINEHLKIRHEHNALRHLFTTVSKPHYVFGFLTTAFLASGGFMLMPFGSAFGTHNMGLSMDELTALYFITGIFSFAAGPLAGKYSDKIGKYKMFVLGTIASMICVVIYTNMGITPLWLASLVSIVLFAAIQTRMIPASALMTAIPTPLDRGAFMSVNSAVMLISGGLASVAAGKIVGEAESGMILNYNTLGYVVVGTMAFMVVMMYFVDRQIKAKLATTPPPSAPSIGEELVMPESV